MIVKRWRMIRPKPKEHTVGEDKKEKVDHLAEQPLDTVTPTYLDPHTYNPVDRVQPMTPSGDVGEISEDVVSESVVDTQGDAAGTSQEPALRNTPSPDNQTNEPGTQETGENPEDEKLAKAPDPQKAVRAEVKEVRKEEHVVTKNERSEAKAADKADRKG